MSGCSRQMDRMRAVQRQRKHGVGVSGIIRKLETQIYICVTSVVGFISPVKKRENHQDHIQYYSLPAQLFCKRYLWDRQIFREIRNCTAMMSDDE